MDRLARALRDRDDPAAARVTAVAERFIREEWIPKGRYAVAGMADLAAVEKEFRRTWAGHPDVKRAVDSPQPGQYATGLLHALQKAADEAALGREEAKPLR